MKILKGLATLSLAAALMWVVVVDFSGVETKYVCAGRIGTGADSNNTEIYIKVSGYRWWVSWWSDSDGSIHLELPSGLIRYFDDVRKVGELIQIYEDEQEMIGEFSTLSNSLKLETGNGTFDGRCKRNE